MGELKTMQRPRVALGTFGHKNSPMDQAEWLLNDIWEEINTEYKDLSIAYRKG